LAAAARLLKAETVKDLSRILLVLCVTAAAGCASSASTVIEGTATYRERMALPPDASLLNTYWRILSLAGEPVSVAESKREPHVILRSAGSSSRPASRR
jgi:uncharacterized lipoprotein YbaY